MFPHTFVCKMREEQQQHDQLVKVFVVVCDHTSARAEPSRASVKLSDVTLLLYKPIFSHHHHPLQQLCTNYTLTTHEQRQFTNQKNRQPSQVVVN